MEEGFLYYEVRTQGLDAQGKTIKDDFLVKSDMLINAVYAALQTAKTDICLKANVSGIKEIVNECDVQKEKRYVVTVEDTTSEHKLKYKMFMYADDIDDARKIISEYLKQGYDFMELTSIVESNISEYVDSFTMSFMNKNESK